MHLNTLTALRLIAQHGPTTTALLRQIEAFNSLPEQGKRAISSLRASGYVEHFDVGGETRYKLSAEGKRFLRELASNQPADNPTPPRGSRLGGHYDGRDLQPYTARAGALEAFELPSLQGDAVVPRMRPISLASRQDIRGVR